MGDVDKPRCVRVIQEWEFYTEELLEDQTQDREQDQDPEDVLRATAETHADLKAMKGLREELERDCE